MNNVVYKTILVGDDGTPMAERAVAVALSLAKGLQAKLIVLGVVPPPSAESQAEGYGFETVPHARARLEERLSQSVEANGKSGAQVVIEIFEGKPEDMIIQRAEQNAADLVVVGHRDIARVRRWLEGSTSESLVRDCPISVLVVHDGV
jgi:nucleotide-binding universal stress UspA family protein